MYEQFTDVEHSEDFGYWRWSKLTLMVVCQPGAGGVWSSKDEVSDFVCIRVLCGEGENWRRRGLLCCPSSVAVYLLGGAVRCT